MDPLMDPAAWPPPPPPVYPPPQSFSSLHSPYTAAAPPPLPPLHVTNNINHHSQPPPPPPLQTPVAAVPPYSEMIIGAITALKEKEGSSRQAIAKYIQSIYPNLPANHPTQLTYHLKKMKNEGALAMVKHSYALPGSVPLPDPNLIQNPSPNPNPTAGPKRKPGRPPKAKNLGPVQAQVQPSGPVFGPADGGTWPVLVQPNAGAGTEKMLVSLGLVDGPGVKRGRGRPPRGSSVGPRPAQVVKEKKPRGRPPRPVRGAGRPVPVAAVPVAAVIGVGKGRRGRPRKVGVMGGKPRGRPRKFPATAAVGAPGGAVAVEGGGVAVKRRGRPPRAGGAVKKPRRMSGKPLGRPKKNASVPPNQVAAHHVVAYQDLKNKLEHFQSRVKQAVNLVKPYFNSETAPFAFGALQELEELSNMDMAAPPQVPAQAQAQAQQPVGQS